MQQQQLPAVAHPDPPLDRSDAAASYAKQALPSRNASSKYDFVKVKVWLGENADHYYVLSRFLLSRMLTVTKGLPCFVLLYQLIKQLVFPSCSAYGEPGYGNDYINHYKMMTRKPLSILTTNDTDYNMQTDMDYELLRTSTDAPLTSVPVWARDFNSPEELITEFCRECRVVRKGLGGDLKKAMKDGKPIIIEGPAGGLEQDGASRSSAWRRTARGARAGRSSLPPPASSICAAASSAPPPNPHLSISALSRPWRRGEGEAVPRAGLPADREESWRGYASSAPCAGEPPPFCFGAKWLGQAAMGCKALLEEWIATRAFRDNCLPQDLRKLINNLKLIQDYLCSFESQGLTIVDMSANSFPQTLDWLHSYLLQCIERGLLAACSESCNEEGN
nr:unnamed protein product [Digitaria exilis]